MTSPHFERLKQVLQAALDLDPEERDAYLREACGDDRALLEDARNKLQRLHEDPGILRSGGIGSLLDATTIGEEEAPAHGESVGPYRLVEVLGEGGMGTVYLAEQSHPIQRRVALKLIKLGMDTRDVVARFEAERQTLAALEHPNVARVYDAGATEEGRPYFVMEYVQGEPITAYCDRRRLRTAERLRLFGEVCRAVHHAHQKGIIHRDVKPSNILVTEVEGKPVPKVIDFGIAKAVSRRLTERTFFTRHGQLIGTPEYMSPEQADPAGLEVDITTDVYSLGVLLYELLTGALPFELEELRRHAWQEIQRRIRETDPPRPSTRVSSQGDRAEETARRRSTTAHALARELRGELDWIIMRAMEKDRARRYGSASELAADVERYTRREPVFARPPSAGYLLRKTVSRHRTAFALSGAAAVVLLGFGVWITVLYARADAALQDAEIARDEAETVTEFMSSTLWSVSPGEKGRDVTVREILDDAAARIGEDFSDRPLVEGRLRTTIGNSYRELGEYEASEEQLIVSLEVQRQALGDDHPLVLGAINNLGYLYTRQGRLSEAESLHVAALEAQRRVLPPGDEELQKSMQNLSLLYLQQARYADAESLLVPLIETRRRGLGADHPMTLGSMNSLAITLFRQQRVDEAEKLWREILERRRRTLGPEHPDLLQSLNNLAVFYASTGRIEEAEPLLRDVIEMQKKVLGETHPRTLISMHNLGTAYGDLDRLAEAKSTYREVYELRERILGPEHPDTIFTKSELGGVLMRQDRFEEARPLIEEVVETAREVSADNKWRLAIYLGNLGACYVGLGRLAEAEPALLEAYGYLKEAHGSGSEREVRCVRDLIEVYEGTGRPTDAEAWRARLPADDEQG